MTKDQTLTYSYPADRPACSGGRTRTDAEPGTGEVHAAGDDHASFETPLGGPLVACRYDRTTEVAHLESYLERRDRCGVVHAGHEAALRDRADGRALDASIIDALEDHVSREKDGFADVSYAVFYVPGSRRPGIDIIYGGGGAISRLLPLTPHRDGSLDHYVLQRDTYGAVDPDQERRLRDTGDQRALSAPRRPLLRSLGTVLRGRGAGR